MRVGQMGAANHDQFDLTIRHDALCRLRVIHAPARCHGNAGFAAHALGDGGEEGGRAPGNFHIGNHEVDADVEQVQSALAHLLGDGNGFLQSLLVSAVVFDDAETRRQWQVLGPDLAHGSHSLQQKACAVVEAAAVGVGALVAVGREKALCQIAVGKVQLQPFKASLQCAAGSGHKVGLHAGDVFQRHGAGRARQTAAKGDG